MPNYKLGNSADMKRFMKDLEKKVLDNAKHQVIHQRYEVQCPHCQAKVRILPGKHPCPACGKVIDFELNVKFKG